MTNIKHLIRLLVQIDLNLRHIICCGIEIFYLQHYFTLTILNLNF